MSCEHRFQAASEEKSRGVMSGDLASHFKPIFHWTYIVMLGSLEVGEMFIESEISIEVFTSKLTIKEQSASLSLVERCDHCGTDVF